MCVWRSAGFSAPSGLSIAGAVSPLVTWELLVWISVCLTGYKQGTALDSHTPGSSAAVQQSWTHTFPLSLLCVDAAVCAFACKCAIVYYFPKALTHNCFMPCQNRGNKHQQESRHKCPLYPSYLSLFPLSFVYLFLFISDPSLLLSLTHIYISPSFSASCCLSSSPFFFSFISFLLHPPTLAHLLLITVRFALVMLVTQKQTAANSFHQNKLKEQK